MSLLLCQDLVKVYPGGKRAVAGVSFHVETGEIVGLLGPNGAGKSTSFRMACGLAAPTQGRVFLNGRDVTNWPMYRRARHGMGYLPQDHSYFVKLTVEENLYAVLEFQSLTYRDRKSKVNKLIDQFGLESRRHQIAHTMSGGEKRRLEIARCLATDPKLILLDEPFAGIDPVSINAIQDVILYLRKLGISVLLTDHNVHETLMIADRSYVICDGRVLVTGDAATVLRDPEALRRYFGDRMDVDSILEMRSTKRAA